MQTPPIEESSFSKYYQPSKPPTKSKYYRPSKQPTNPIKLDSIVKKVEIIRDSIEIRKIDSTESIPIIDFMISSYKNNNGVLEILITDGNFEVEALFDEKNNKIYLVDGKYNNDSIQNNELMSSQSKTNEAWKSLDLSKTGKTGEFTILTKVQYAYLNDMDPKESGGGYTKEEVLMKITI